MTAKHSRIVQTRLVIGVGRDTPDHYVWRRSSSQFTHGLATTIDGEEHYFAGAPDGRGGASDIPRHTSVKTGPNSLRCRPYNPGPSGASQW